MKSVIPLLLLLALAFTGCAAMAQKGAFSRANKAIKEKRYEDALIHVARAEKYAEITPELKAEATFLRAQSYEGVGRIPDAIGAYKYLVATFGDTSYAYQAKERLEYLRERRE